MTLHFQPASPREALPIVLSIAEQIDAEGLSAAERANIAVTYMIENANTPWPLALQREVLAAATKALQSQSNEPEPPATPAPVAKAEPIRETSGDMMTLANGIVHSLSEILDFTELAAIPRAEQETLIRDAIRSLSGERKMHLNGNEVDDLVKAVLADMLGLGPLEPLLADPDITDIMVNGPHKVFVERHGKLTLTKVQFRDNAHVFAVASRIVAAVGRRIDESQPMVDARLKDGSRVNVTVPPLAIDGPTITIRKFPASPVKLDTLVAGGSLTSQMAAFLGLAAYLRLNILVSGGTGSGKTTRIQLASATCWLGPRNS